MGAQPCREVIGYYPGWKWSKRNYLVNPQTIQYDRYTTINYAFFEPLPDGRVVPFDGATDKTILLGQPNEDAPAGYLGNRSLCNPSFHDRRSSLVYQAHQHGVKVSLSIGGWTLTKNFPSIAASEVKRQTFANACADLVRFYGIDGIDIDWEYPGYVSNNGSPADKQNFTLLLREVRRSLNALETELGKKLWLSAAFGVAPVRMENIEWEEVAPLLDHINMMTYDFYGGNYWQTNHHAPLYAPHEGLEGYDLNSVVTRLRNEYGVPEEKITIGLAFYGRSLKTKGSPGLHVATEKVPDTHTFEDGNGAPQFYTILAKQHLFYYHWDQEAQAPYLQSREPLNTFVSFEDENSVARKGRYIIEQNLGGAIIWDITGDYVETHPGSGVIALTPLAKALSDALCGRWYFEEDFNPVSIFSHRRQETLPPCDLSLQCYSTLPRVYTSKEPQLTKKQKRKLRKKQKRDRKKQKRTVYFYE